MALLHYSAAQNLATSATRTDMRRAQRYAFRMPVTLLRGRVEIPVVTEDVSDHGLFLETDELPPIRYLLRLRVLLPSHDRRLDLFGMAVHHLADLGRQPGVGVQLYAMDRAMRAIWEKFVTGVRLGELDPEAVER